MTLNYALYLRICPICIHTYPPIYLNSHPKHQSIHLLLYLLTLLAISLSTSPIYALSKDQAIYLHAYQPTNNTTYQTTIKILTHLQTCLLAYVHMCPYHPINQSTSLVWCVV